MRWAALLLTASLQSPLLGTAGVEPAVAQAPTASFDDLFASSTVLEFQLQAPVHKLFDQARKYPDASVIGTLIYTSASGKPVRLDGIGVSVRGHSSMQETECVFPKLKLTLPDAPEPPFTGIDSLKIGTHCGESPEGKFSERYGRWANEKAAHREAFVYHLLEAMQIRSLKARPARITYVEDGRAPLVRNAFVLEDDSQAAKRLGANGEVKEKEFTSVREALRGPDAARLAFAEAMIGNFDWCLRFWQGDNYRCNTRHPLWNILAFQTAEGLVPVMYDFDLSGMVIGKHTWFRRVFGTYPGSEPEVEVLSQVQRTRTLFSRKELDATRMEFVRGKSAAYQLLAQTPLDEEGRRSIESYLNSFFAVIESDDRFYGPVVVAKDAHFLVDAADTTPACGGEALLPGTPVSEVLETRDGMVRVHILNALWQWDGERRKCEQLHSGPVWIESTAISKEYPQP